MNSYNSYMKERYLNMKDAIPQGNETWFDRNASVEGFWAPGTRELCEQAYRDGAKEKGIDFSASPQFVDFMRNVHGLVEGTAKSKGYSAGGSEGQNILYDAVYSVAGNGHALGEIMYKCVRYGRKGLLEDVYKIAAWAYLIVRHGQKEKV